MPVNYSQIPLYRMIHIDNAEYVLRNGLCTSGHPSADPGYISIGDNHLIAQRGEYSVGINPPGGNLGNYVPFYFAGHSPMLLNIKTGWRGVEKRQQQDIIFIVTSVRHILENCDQWCFTDGHAKHIITAFYNNINDLSNLDWDTISQRVWRNTLDDMDRQRKKEAEFLVKDLVPVKCICKIYVFNESSCQSIQQIVDGLSLDIEVRIDTDKILYYP